MFVLWKDHTATKEADEINKLAKTWGGTDYTKYEGGIYSSEWFWAKILHVLRADQKVLNAAFSWVEHCDWIPAILTGQINPLTMKRSRCAAGHKAMWHPDFNGLPSEEFLVKLDPLLKGLRDRLFKETYTCEVKVGNLTDEWAKRLGLIHQLQLELVPSTLIWRSGGEIKPHYLSKVMALYLRHVNRPMKEMEGKLVKGICGQVDGLLFPECWV